MSASQKVACIVISLCLTPSTCLYTRKQVCPGLTALLFVGFVSSCSSASFSREDVGSLCPAIPEDAWCHLVYLIITLPALLHNAALSLLRHLKCLAGLFSETIMKLCAKTLQTVPPLFTLQPCVQEPEKDSSTAAQSKGKQTRQTLQPSASAHSHRFYWMYGCRV